MEIVGALSSALGLGIGAGLNSWATLLVCGLIARWKPEVLPTQLAHVLGSTPVLIVVAVLYLIEFFADKIPAVDHLWDLVHTLIRPLAGAVVVLATAKVDLPPAVVVLAVAIGGGSALAAHATKASIRAASTVTTGGLGNPFLSLAEDLFAFGGAATAIFLPFLILVFVACLALPVVAVLRWRRSKP